ncbi:MAG: ribonuclease Z [Elusimicrobiota bacterium]
MKGSEAFDFVVLGSGCYEPGLPGPGKVRNPAGYAVRRGDQVLLFDLGFGNLRQLVRAGLRPDEVSHVFVTHRHPDHIGDLPALLFYYRYDGRPRRGRLRLYGPRGFRNFLERLTRAHHPWLRPRGFRMSVEELEEPAVVRGEGWRVACREVPHTTESLAYRFECRGGSVCYTGDTEWDSGLARFAAGTDLLVVECSLADRARTAGHLRVSEAIRLGRMSGARRVLLTHFSPASEKGLSRRIARDRRFRKAEDLMRIRIGRTKSGKR